MQDFKNVSVVAKANVYFDGKVTSRTVLFADGTKKTLGIMLPGDYEFSTGDREVMEVLGGSMDVKLPGENAFRTYREGDSYVVPAKSSFSLVIREVADYCCSYGN
jgi:purine/pyrimidine-nucleoside phosphorylase